MVISNGSPPAFGKRRTSCITLSRSGCPGGLLTVLGLFYIKIKSNQEHPTPLLYYSGWLYAIHLFLCLWVFVCLFVFALFPTISTFFFFSTHKLKINYICSCCQIFKLCFIYLKTMLCFFFYIHHSCNKDRGTRACCAFISIYISSEAVKSPFPLLNCQDQLLGSKRPFGNKGMFHSSTSLSTAAL